MKRLKCPDMCPCICHDGYGGEHPNKKCEGKQLLIEQLQKGE